jgi:hypothetical protein
MSAPAFKTRSEQKAEWLAAERVKRPLTESEWAELSRAEHAIYVRTWRQNALERHRREELELLEKLRAEARMPEWYPRERV